MKKIGLPEAALDEQNLNDVNVAKSGYESKVPYQAAELNVYSDMLK